MQKVPKKNKKLSEFIVVLIVLASVEWILWNQLIAQNYDSNGRKRAIPTRWLNLPHVLKSFARKKREILISICIMHRPIFMNWPCGNRTLRYGLKEKDTENWYIKFSPSDIQVCGFKLSIKMDEKQDAWLN